MSVSDQSSSIELESLFPLVDLQTDSLDHDNNDEVSIPLPFVPHSLDCETFSLVQRVNTRELLHTQTLTQSVAKYLSQPLTQPLTPHSEGLKTKRL